MRRTTIMAAALALPILVTGCSTGGGDDDAQSTTRPSVSTSSSSSDSGDSDHDSDDGDGDHADGDLVAWAGQMCDAVRPMVEQTESLAPPTDFSDPSSFLEQYQSMIGDLGDAFDDARDAIAALDPPPVDNGAEIKQDMLTILDQASSIYERLEGTFATLDPNDPSSFASIGSELQELLPDLEDAARDLDGAFGDDTLKDAVAAAPQCEGMDLGR
jgi:hypothetical protein